MCFAHPSSLMPCLLFPQLQKLHWMHASCKSAEWFCIKARLEAEEKNIKNTEKSFKKLQSSWKFASKPDWRLNIWSGDQKWRNGNKHRKYLEKYLEIYLHKKLDYFCNLTFSMALYKSLAYSWTGIITSQPNPIIRKSEIWFHHKKRMEHIIIAGKDNFRRNPHKKFWNTYRSALLVICMREFFYIQNARGTCL